MPPADPRLLEFPNAAKALEQMPEATRQALSGICQSQAEAAQLMSRRARAWLELPATLSSCRTLPEVTRAQTEFVQAFWSDWLATTHRMTQAWASLSPAGATEPRPGDRPRTPDKPDESDPMAVWQWWRTDMKSIVPRRNAGDSSATSRNGTH